MFTGGGGASRRMSRLHWSLGAQAREGETEGSGRSSAQGESAGLRGGPGWRDREQGRSLGGRVQILNRTWGCGLATRRKM